MSVRLQSLKIVVDCRCHIPPLLFLFRRLLAQETKLEMGIALNNSMNTNQYIHIDVLLWYSCQHHTKRGYSSPQIQLRCLVPLFGHAREQTRGTGIPRLCTARDMSYRPHSGQVPAQSACLWCTARWTADVGHALHVRVASVRVWTPPLRAPDRFQNPLDGFARSLPCIPLLVLRIVL